MRQHLPLFILACALVAVPGCSSSDNKNGGNENSNIYAERNKEADRSIERGSYLVTITGCNDCHTPKIFDQKGMSDDESRLLSGHPANEPLFSVQPESLKPGNYIQASPGLTAWAGPWGVSYTANLTPDSATGMGAWTEEVFVKTLRTGKHLGQENGRPVLPPMPWFNFAKMTDDDLSAIYAYLRSIPPVSNRVPAPIAPNEVPANQPRAARNGSQ